MGDHNYSTHADVAFEGAKTQSDSTWQGDLGHEMAELGQKFGSTPTRELTEAEIQTLAEELGEIERNIDNGDFEAAAVRLNSFWEDWTAAALSAHFQVANKNDGIGGSHCSRLSQAKKHGLLGERIYTDLDHLRDLRNDGLNDDGGPAHKTWSDVDSRGAFRETVRDVYRHTKRHHEHLVEEHT